MKRKEAIKQIKEGKIQVCNDLLPSTKEIKKFLKEAFPDDEMEENNYYILNKFFKKDSTSDEIWFSSSIKFNLPSIKLSTITKRKKTKLSQLEKLISDVVKDVAELRQTLAKDVEVDAEEIQQETIKEEEIDFSVPQILEYNLHNCNYFVVTNGNHTLETFEATVIESNNKTKVIGYFSVNFEKHYFKKFKGELTIK